MDYNYLALIQGGLGPDVWDKELQISAADFRDAAGQAAAQAEELGEQVVELNQNDWNASIEGSMRSALEEIRDISWDFNDGQDCSAWMRQRAERALAATDNAQFGGNDQPMPRR